MTSTLLGLERVLRGAGQPWTCSFVAGGRPALAELERTEIYVVLCDLRMPDLDGLGLLTQLRENQHTRDLPFIILTGANEPGLKRQALDLGATDLLTKPADPDELIARLRSAVLLKTQQDQLKLQNSALERLVSERTAALEDSRLDILWRLGKAAEYRDEDTGNHVMRVGCYARVLGEALGLPREHVETLFLASPLHDIGKIGIPDHVLLKQEALTPQEWTIMQRHCEIGAKILRQQSKFMGQFLAWRVARRPRAAGDQNPLIDIAASIALCHHERWDGLGYPAGLSGSRVPLHARIVAVADCYDVLLSERPYRSAFPEETVLRTIRGGRGTHFDPDVCTAFDSCLNELRAIRRQLADGTVPVGAGER